MGDGSQKPIELVEMDDMILASRDFGTMRAVRVKQRLTEMTNDTYQLTFSDEQTLHVSGRQKLLTVAGYVTAKDLLVGAPMLSSSRSPKVLVKKDQIEEPVLVHFLGLDDDERYPVGTSGVMARGGNQKE